MPTPLPELKALIGKETEAGDWFLIAQERVNQFADVTGDHQYIHVDPERAKATPFGGTIAHGFLTLSMSLMLPRYREGAAEVQPAYEPQASAKPRMTVNYGLNRVRFPAPVPVGKRVRGKTQLLSVEEVSPDALQTVTQIIIEVEGQDKPAAVIELVTRHYY